MSTISNAKKRVEVFFQQSQMASKFHHQREHFRITTIINDQYTICITVYFSNSTLNKKTINIVIFIIIQTWHYWMGHIGYQNILRLPKAVDDIDIKGLILVEICENCMKKRYQRKSSYKPIL